MRIPVGPFSYTVELVDDYPTDGRGNPCLGTCDTTAQAIRISRQAPPGKRWAVFWHEFAHAIKTELDIADAQTLAEEPLCNLIGLGMAGLTPRHLCGLHVLLMRGRPADDVLMLGGKTPPIPLVHFNSGV